MQLELSFEVPIVLAPDATRVYCSGCQHSEFVHCDGEPRRCLYSECSCGDFFLAAAEGVNEPPAAAESVNEPAAAESVNEPPAAEGVSEPLSAADDASEPLSAADDASEPLSA